MMGWCASVLVWCDVVGGGVAREVGGGSVVGDWMAGGWCVVRQL